MKRRLLILLVAITKYVAIARRRYIDTCRLVIKSVKFGTPAQHIDGLKPRFLYARSRFIHCVFYNIAEKGNGGNVDTTTTNGESIEFKIIIPL